MYKEVKKYFHLANIILGIYFISFVLSFMLTDKLTIIDPSPITQLPSLQNAKTSTIFLGIAITNILGAFIMAALGILFGISSITYLIKNGAIFGSAFFNTFEATTLTNTLLAYGPHAIFEIPALILSMTIGVSIGNMVIKEYDKRYKNNKTMKIVKIIILTMATIALIVPTKYFGDNSRIIKALLLVPLFWLMIKATQETKLFESKEWKKTIFRGLNTFIKIVIPLYIIAALIEIR